MTPSCNQTQITSFGWTNNRLLMLLIISFIVLGVIICQRSAVSLYGLSIKAPIAVYTVKSACLSPMSVTRIKMFTHESHKSIIVPCRSCRTWSPSFLLFWLLHRSRWTLLKCTTAGENQLKHTFSQQHLMSKHQVNQAHQW